MDCGARQATRAAHIWTAIVDYHDVTAVAHYSETVSSGYHRAFAVDCFMLSPAQLSVQWT